MRALKDWLKDQLEAALHQLGYLSTKFVGQLEAAALQTFLQRLMMLYSTESTLFQRLLAPLLHFLLMLRMCWPLVPSMLFLKEFLLYVLVVTLDHMLKLSQILLLGLLRLLQVQ